MVPNEVAHIISRVGRRLRINGIGRYFYISMVILCGLYLVLFIASRLLSLIPFDFTFVSVFLPICIALCIAVLIPSGRSVKRAARAIDRKGGEKDLFLTATFLSDWKQGFAPLVLNKAVQRSREINPSSVISLNIKKPLLISAGFLAFLIPAVLFLPHFDPFSRGEDDARKKTWQKRLQESRKKTGKRKEFLKMASPGKKQSMEIEKAIQQLKTDLKNMKTGKKTGNLKNLKRDQEKMGDLWRKIAEKKLGKGQGRGSEPQRFGRFHSEKSSQWKKEMDQGNADGVKQEINEVKRMLKRLSKEKNKQKREDLKKQVRKKLEDLSQFMSDNMQNSACSKALNRALDQLDMSGIEGLRAEALDALKESLNLSEMEIENLARSIRDLQKLQQALKTIQQAKRINREGNLDKIFEDCDSLAEYEKLYKDIISKGSGNGTGPGPGMGGPGIGEGGKAPEDASQKTDFKPEMSQSALNAGKILLKWKTREMGSTGKMNEDYTEAVDEVKSGVSEAIIKGDIPPYYHDSIKHYFDEIK